MDVQALRIFAGEDLKSRLLMQLEEALLTDVKLVCVGGVVNVHKTHLQLYLPEVAQWVPPSCFDFDIVVNLADEMYDQVQEAVRQMYIDDNPDLVRSMFGLLSRAQIIQLIGDNNLQEPVDEIVADNNSINFVEVKMQKEECIEEDYCVNTESEDIFNELPQQEIAVEPGERLKFTKLFPCPVCIKVFTTPHYLRLHEVKAHDSSVLISQHRCLSHPDEHFPNINRLTEHFNSEHNQRLIRDLLKKGRVAKTTAGRKKRDQVDLEKETIQLLQEPPAKQKEFVCAFCPSYATDKEESMTNHIELCHTPVECDMCYKQISSRRNLASHISYIHKVEGSGHVCQECGKEYPTMQSLRKHHDAKHAPEKRFKCDECPKSYGSKTMLKEHVESKHRDAQYPCATCGKIFGSKSLLRGHEQTHSEYRKFGCDECDKRFRTREKLKNHQSVHSNIKHPCLVCGSQFSRLETLKVHMKIHDESRAFKCDECGKLFDTSQKHKEHMNTHTGDKPFECSACGSAFSSSSSLCHHKKHCTYNIKVASMASRLELQARLPPVSPLSFQHTALSKLVTTSATDGVSLQQHPPVPITAVTVSQTLSKLTDRLHQAAAERAAAAAAAAEEVTEVVRVGEGDGDGLESVLQPEQLKTECSVEIYL